MIDNESAGLDAWVGAIAVILFSGFYYIAVLPPLREIYETLITPALLDPDFMFTASYYQMLKWFLDWAPVIFVLIALFWAVIAPARDQTQTYRGRMM